MITVQMTEDEYKAYKLYLKSIKFMLEVESKGRKKTSLDKYLSEPENRKEIEMGLDDISAGRVTFVDTANLWESIK